PLAWAVDFFRPQEPDSPEAAPASPDYVPGPEEPEQAPFSPGYVPEPEYPEYLALSDEEVPIKDQPNAIADSPIALSPCYVADSDPEEDSEDGPVDYPADGGDDDDDDSSDDDEEEEESSKEEEAEEEEEEHLALADSVIAPVVDHVPSSEETEPFETDESVATPPSPPACQEGVERLLALPPPPPSPLISLSPPSAEERLARCLAAPALSSSPLPIVPHPYGSPNHVRAPLGFRAAMGRLRASSPSTHHPLHPSPPLPPPPSSLHLPPHVPMSLPLPSSPLLQLPASLFIPPLVDRREDTPEAELPPRKRLCLTALTSRTRHKRQYDRRINERQMQSRESKVISSKALDASLVVTECSGTNSDEHITSISSRTDIRPVNDQVSSAEVHLTAQHNVLANEQRHTDQSEPSYDTYLLEKDAEQDQVKSPLLKAEFLKMNDMVEKEVYNELSNRFLQLEKHCISLEISMQQKEESFQSNKPCKNQESPEFREFFEINDLKAQLQAKTTLICNLKNQIKSVKEASNEAKLKNDIDVIETINIKLEHKVTKLLKENETLKKHYKVLYDSIKITRSKTIEQTTFLLANNVDLKAQIQEKVFAIAALENELRKLKGNSIDTKFAKTSVLGKPVLQPLRNQSVVRQPNAFKSERPKISKSWVSSQVDVEKDLSKPVTQHCFPKGKESAFVKPTHMIASSSSRNSSKNMLRFSSNYMVHNHSLEDAKKKTQEKDRNSESSVIHSTRLQHTTNDHKTKPRSNNQTTRGFPVSKSSCVTSNVVPLVDHSRNSSRIFKTAGLRWISTGKMFTDNRTKVDSEPLNGSNEDITNPYECDQTLNVSADTLNLSAGFKEFNYEVHVRWRLQTTLQAPFLKEKKGVRFSALYLQKKRNLLVFDHP
ncbi:hypothetical protein Tco_1387231, partial [Tanacetum coccineum]